MTGEPLNATWLVILSVSVGSLVATLGAAMLPRLREPDDSDDSDDQKIPYAALGTPWFLTATGACAAIGALVTVGLLGFPHALALVGLGTLGVLLAAIDARTTYLPLSLTRAGWTLTALGVGAVAILARSWEPLAFGALGAAGLGGFFWLFWRFSSGIGFGDVRLAALIGAATGSIALRWTLWSAVLGSVIGVLLGLAWTWARRRRGVTASGFPYGPALVAGPYAALLLLQVAG